MSTFYTHGPRAMLDSVADAVDSIPATVDVHTITLVLNGRHGEFDLTVIGSDEDNEQVEYVGVAHRNGGVTPFHRVNPQDLAQVMCDTWNRN